MTEDRVKELEALRAQVDALMGRVAELETKQLQSETGEERARARRLKARRAATQRLQRETGEERARAPEPSPVFSDTESKNISAETEPTDRPTGAEIMDEFASASWLRSMEQWTAIVWIAVVGALLFLLGAVYFLYWSIEQGLIGPHARVAMGCAVAIAGGRISLRSMERHSIELGGAFFLASLGTWTFTFYYAAMVVGIFPVLLGFGATVFAVLLSALLAIRMKTSAFMGIAYTLGLFAPLIFSTGSGDYPILTAYLIGLMLLCSVIFYRYPQAATWIRVRQIAVLGTGILLLTTLSVARPDQRLVLLIEMIGVYLAFGVWIWIPRGAQLPSGAKYLWLVSSLGVTWCGVMLWWRGYDWNEESFAIVLVGQALLALGLIVPVRRRLGDRSGDFVLMTLALVHVFAAIPTVWDSPHFATTWSLFFIPLAYAALQACRRGYPDHLALERLALLAGLFSSCVWVNSAIMQHGPTVLWMNSFFIGGLLCAIGWLILSGRPTASLNTALWVGEIIAHITIGDQVDDLMRAGGASARVATVASTIFFALSGSVQWLLSLRGSQFWVQLAPVGYALLGIASIKLLVFDLAGVGTIVRALATLAVASVFLTTAFLASRTSKGKSR